MAITPPSAITVAIDPLPQPPQTSDPANFDTRADAFVLAEQTFSQQVELGRKQINENAVSVAGNAQQAYDSANAAVNAPGSGATSSTSMTIGSGNRAFTIQAGKQFARGQLVTIAYTTDPTIRMYGPITAYDSSTGAITVQCEGSVGTGVYAAWTISLAGYTLTTLPSGATTSTAAANLVLTAAATNQQSVSPTALGVSVLLPDATSLFAGPKGTFTLSNKSTKFPLGIKDGTGKLLGVIPPGETATCIPSNTSTTAGVWEVDCRILWGALLCGESAEMPGFAAPDARFTASWGAATRIVALSPTLAVALCSASGGGLSAFAINLSTMTFGAKVLLSGGTSASDLSEVYVVSATTGVFVFGSSGTIYAQAFSISGTTVTPGTAVGSSVTFGATAQFGRVFQLTATTYILCGAGNAQAFSVSGVTVSFGGLLNGILPGGTANGAVWTKVSATKIVGLSLSANGGYPYINVINISGSTLTKGSEQYFPSMSTGCVGGVIINMPGTNNYVVGVVTGSSYLNIFSITENSGVFTTITSPIAFPSFDARMPSFLAGASAFYMEAYSATKVVFITSHTSGSFIGTINVAAGGALTPDKAYSTGQLFSERGGLIAKPSSVGGFAETLKLGAGLYMGANIGYRSTNPDLIPDDTPAEGNIVVLKYDGSDFSTDDVIYPRGVVARSLFGQAYESTGYQSANIFSDGAENVVGGKGDFWVMAGRRSFDAAKAGNMRLCQQVARISSKYAVRLGATMKDGALSGNSVPAMVAQVFECVAV